MYPLHCKVLLTHCTGGEILGKLQSQQKAKVTTRKSHTTFFKVKHWEIRRSWDDRHGADKKYTFYNQISIFVFYLAFWNNQLLTFSLWHVQIVSGILMLRNKNIHTQSQ